ncbi:MAG TPA: GNAT family N-acetyltransferase [Pyrinomonadaceae bacterium]|nr:GNAT family N-acetyltransferase [Pyrinomonadaceae bacterium]
MDVEIRHCTPEDIPAIVRLMRDFAEFENLGHFFETTEERLHNSMFGKNGFVEGLVAVEDGRAFGYALFYPYFASFRGQTGFYLEDIYIHEDYRQHGIGRAMVRSIAALAAERGHERLDFQVLDWNTPACNFYLKLGAVRDDDERHFKFIDDGFRNLVA